MDPAVLAALIGLAGVAAGSALALCGQGILERHRVRREAAALIARYRDPLSAAATDLHWSLYNILRQGFLWRYVADERHERRQVAIDTTTYNLAQYFAWREILRQEIQFLELADEQQTREINSLMGEITSRFSVNYPENNEVFRLWKAEQRAIGELMIIEVKGRLTCMGYARFLQQGRAELAPWLHPLEADLIELARIETPNNHRLRDIQHRLAELAERLDRQGTRREKPLPRA